MENWYIIFNIFMLIILVFLLYKAYKFENNDIKKIHDKYLQIVNNTPCLNYLRALVSMPTWRFSFIYSAIFTIILFLLYIIAGFPINDPKIIASFWILFLLTAFFIYKLLGIRTYHYICRDACILNWPDKI